MPELPEVQTVLDGVTEYLKDKEIRGLDCFYPGTVVKDPELAKNPFPARLNSHERRGKYMILHLSGESSLIIHLRMTGKLVQGEAMPGKSPHERACFLLSGGKKLHFIDIRTFGKIVLCKTANLGKFMPDLGIEPLSAGFTGEIWPGSLPAAKPRSKTSSWIKARSPGLATSMPPKSSTAAGFTPKPPPEKSPCPA